MGTIYHVAILVLQLKPQYTYWNLDSIMSRGKGQAPLRVRDTLANAQDYTLWAATWIGLAGPHLR